MRPGNNPEGRPGRPEGRAGPIAESLGSVAPRTLRLLGTVAPVPELGFASVGRAGPLLRLAQPEQPHIDRVRHHAVADRVRAFHPAASARANWASSIQPPPRSPA